MSVSIQILRKELFFRILSALKNWCKYVSWFFVIKWVNEIIKDLLCYLQISKMEEGSCSYFLGLQAKRNCVSHMILWFLSVWIKSWLLAIVTGFCSQWWSIFHSWTRIRRWILRVSRRRRITSLRTYGSKSKLQRFS